MDLIDTHAHLEDLENLEESLERASVAGVIAVITMGSDYESNLWALRAGGAYKGGRLMVYPALGIHPWNLDASKIEENIKLIRENVDRVVALGEIGLDYWYREVRRNREKREEQMALFRRLLEIAERNSKPVSIHSRGAWEDAVEITIESGVKRAVFHWFTGPPTTLNKLLAHGYYVSATPAAAYSKEHRRVIQDTPLENLILETDSPVEYQGEPAEPSHILKALAAVAQLKGEKEELVAEKTTENARSIFKF